MVLQFMLEGPQPCTILCFNVRTTAEYLNRNVSIGQLLQHITKSIVVCARSKPNMLTKTIARLHNYTSKHVYFLVCLLACELAYLLACLCPCLLASSLARVKTDVFLSLSLSVTANARNASSNAERNGETKIRWNG